MFSIFVPAAFFAIFVVAAIAYLFFAADRLQKMQALFAALASLGVTIVTFVLTMVISIPPGHYGVASLFGDVQQKAYPAGLHFANPLYDWTTYDCRQKTHPEKAQVPSQDQLLTQFDVSVQYNIDGQATPRILQETGLASDIVNVHLTPKFRSILREQGKTVEHAEDFFKEETQLMLQDSLLSGMREYLTPKGIIVDAVLLREIRLPQTIQEGVEAKKKREQDAERQKAELLRYETEQQQKVAEATAERQAAEEEAKRVKVLAEAEAFKIEAINKAIAENPAYIQLQALETLGKISQDPAAKIYFLNGDSPSPLPLMHIGEAAKKAVK